ncbi:MAG: RecQ family ATP-dependent DNA helicase [Spirochaetaceae bacterium]|nr:RecQ family ATP-dependent DNA helicase [Spirochaetaceae bacterium]
MDALAADFADYRTDEDDGGEPCAANAPDPISAAVQELFGLSYLFPYQRLVVSNILEAAEAGGIAVRWPSQAARRAEADIAADDAEAGAENGGENEAKTDAENDRGSLGRQIVILPTGAGKSLCFQLPAMLLDGPTLVIYPLLSLMADQDRRLAEKNFAPVTLRGGQSREERESVFRRIKSGESRFIIANPEVLLTQSVMEKLPELGIVHVVVDESHCVSEWGESFRPSYLEAGRIVEATLAPMVTAFTATASAAVLEKIDRIIFGGKGAHRIIGNPDRGNICYHAVGTLLRDRTVRSLLARHQRPAIVFCSSRPGTEKLARYLRNELGETGIKFYHAGLTREEKSAVEKWFFDSAEGVLVATCAYGMGVDKSNIRTVIHRDCPPSVEAYLQESGRAGRDGLPSRAFFLWGAGDEHAMRRAATDAGKKRLADLLAYGRNAAPQNTGSQTAGSPSQNTAGQCRRDLLLDLLNYEGERSKPETDCCDVCEGTSRPGIIEEEPLMAFFKRNPRSFTRNEATDLLSSDAANGWSEEETRAAIRGLLRARKLRESKHPPWKGKITCHEGPRRGFSGGRRHDVNERQAQTAMQFEHGVCVANSRSKSVGFATPSGE